MNKLLLLAAGALLAGLAVAAEAKPFSAGKCTILDDGTDQPPPGWNDRRQEPISMELPKQPPNALGRIDNSFIVDVVFSVKADGTTTSPKVLCSNASDPAYVRTLIEAARQWRFRPTDPAGLKAASELRAYRVIVTARGVEAKPIPLGSSAA